MRDQELRQCRAAFEQFCERYQPFFHDKRQRAHLRPYLLGLLGLLERKSVEPIALEQGVSVKQLQHFIGEAPWDDRPLLVEHRRHVQATLGSRTGVFILDSTAFPKRGDQSVGVARQWCGQLGKTENCQVAVTLAYAAERGHTFLDRRLYVPQSWAADAARRRAAGVPAEVVFRPSWQLAYEMLRHARAEGLRHAWITGDEEFGKVPRLHDWLAADGERYIFELPSDTQVWLTLPRGPLRGRRGWVQRLAALRPGRPRLMRVAAVAEALPPRAWTPVHIRNASKGPLWVEAVALRVRFHRGPQNTRPGGWLVIAETLDQRRQRKGFASNAAPECSLAALLSAAYARWPIEQDHGQGKHETGLGQYETRTWLGWHHHTALSLLAHHFLVLQRNRLGEKISRDDGRGGAADRDGGMSAQPSIAPEGRGAHGIPPAAQPAGADGPLEASARRRRASSRAPAPRSSSYFRHYASPLKANFR